METESCLTYKMLLIFVALMVTIQCGWCDKAGLKLFRENYKSVEETCLAVGFVRNKSKDTSKTNHRVIAFDAWLKHHKRNLGQYAKVVFEGVGLNEGLGYDASTGVFTAPSGGIYVFDWTILTMHRQNAYTSLVVNNQFKSYSHCNDVNSKTYLPCSKMTIVKLKQGDKAWIGITRWRANIYNQYTSFSGYKL